MVNVIVLGYQFSPRLADIGGLRLRDSLVLLSVVLEQQTPVQHRAYNHRAKRKQRVGEFAITEPDPYFARVLPSASNRFRQCIYDQAFVQGGLGRGRGINRSAATPLEIHIFGNVPLPVPVATIAPWRKLSSLAKMILRGNVPLNAADMRRFHPDLFRSEDVAR